MLRSKRRALEKRGEGGGGGEERQEEERKGKRKKQTKKQRKKREKGWVERCVCGRIFVWCVYFVFGFFDPLKGLFGDEFRG